MKLANIDHLLTIEEIVNHTNNSPLQGFEWETPELVAATYAVKAQEENGYPMDENAAYVHLDVLVDAGAEFDYSEAVKLAISYKEV